MTEDKLKRLIASQMKLYGYNAEYMATKFRIKKVSWYKRMQSPLRMTYGDMCKLDKMLHLGLINDP